MNAYVRIQAQDDNNCSLTYLHFEIASHTYIHTYT